LQAKLAKDTGGSDATNKSSPLRSCSSPKQVLPLVWRTRGLVVAGERCEVVLPTDGTDPTGWLYYLFLTATDSKHSWQALIYLTAEKGAKMKTFLVTKWEEIEKWQDILERFSERDVYYLNAYVAALMLHGDGEPLLFYYRDQASEICYVVLKSDISEAEGFDGLIKKGEFFDLATPYGYGGFLFEGEITEAVLKVFFLELQKYCREQKIVSQFIRFHPLLQNQKLLGEFCEPVKWKQTVYIDTSSPEIIVKNMTSTNRNILRKDINKEIMVDSDRGENLGAFIDIYNETMEATGAEPYYYFSKEYFEYLIKNMDKNLMFFYAKYEGKIIGSSLILYDENTAHYHLAGKKQDTKNLASMNRILYEVSLWAFERGIKKFHLGGGIAAEDGLFAFKKSFNKNGLVDFYIGRNIFMPEEFEQLVELRSMADKKFDPNNKFMIKYRAD
jgi:hypothetical protein